MRIERVDNEWESQAVAEYVDILKQEIAKVFIVPEYMLRSPDLAMRAHREAYERTELMRRELIRLTMLYSRPRMLIAP